MATVEWPPRADGGQQWTTRRDLRFSWLRRVGGASGRAILLVGLESALDRRSGLAADAAYGEYLAAECASCHRPDGGKATIPSLDLFSYDSLFAALREYRDGMRANAATQAVACSLGDEEIEALAAYVSGRS